jgi:hypothetical protein
MNGEDKFGNETVDSFAARIKSARPAYKNEDNADLVARWIRAKPVYQNRLSKDELMRLARGKDTSSILQGVISEVGDYAKTLIEPKEYLKNALDPTGGTRGVLAQLPLIGRAAKDVYQQARHPLTPQPKMGLHIAEAMMPLAGPMAAKLEEAQPNEAIGRGIVDIGLLGGTELFRAFKGGKVKPEQLTIPQQKDIIGRVSREAILKADNALREEVGTHVENYLKAVDDPQRNPNGAIEAKDTISKLQDVWNEYVSTYTPGLGIKPPAAFQQVVNEAMQSPRWTARQATQIRSTIGEIAGESKIPRLKAIAGQVYDTLTNQLREEAKKAGVLDDFNTYNELHKKRMTMHDTLLKGMKGQESGESVLGRLRGKEGYLRNTVLPSLKEYGLDTKSIEDALDATAKGSKPKRIHEWMLRYAGGAALHAVTGLPWMVGAAATGLTAEGLEAAKTGKVDIPITPSFKRGQQLVRESITPGRTPVSEPSSIPERPPETPRTQKALPPIPQVRSETPKVEVKPEPKPAPVVDKYAKTKETLTYARTLNRAITKLSKGARKALSGAEIGWIEKETGLDMSDPVNISKARKILADKRTQLNKGVLPEVPKVGNK